MNIIYYIEINLLCIIILLLIRSQKSSKFTQLSTSDRIFSLLMWSTVILCISDMVAGVIRGQTFYGAHRIIEGVNLIFFIALTLISYLWMLYVYTKLKIFKYFDKKKIFLLAFPLLIFSMIAFSNPITHFLFIIDEQNLYHRNIGIYLHWIITWTYLIVPTVHVILRIAKENNRQSRQELIPLTFFIIAPTIAGITQMIFYGVTSSQVGVTLSLIMIHIIEQRNQILTDSLTGLDNRHSLNKYIEHHIQRHSGGTLTLFMIDLNNFKQINDKYNHMVGDRALIESADALIKACCRITNRMFLCRYGGDEFLIAVSDLPTKDSEQFNSFIQEEFANKNKIGGNPYQLTISIGMSQGSCLRISDFEQLLCEADEAMYDAKRRFKTA